MAQPVQMTATERESYSRGRAHFERGEVDPALEAFASLLRTKDGFADIHYMVGVLFDRRGDLDAGEMPVVPQPHLAEAALPHRVEVGVHHGVDLARLDSHPPDWFSIAVADQAGDLSSLDQNPYRRTVPLPLVGIELARGLPVVHAPAAGVSSARSHHSEEVAPGLDGQRSSLELHD